MPRTIPYLPELVRRFCPVLLALTAGLHSLAADVTATEVGEVPLELRERLKLDPYYAKHANTAGLPVLSSAKVSDTALLEAARLIETMLSQRPDVLAAMVAGDVRFVVMAPDEMTTDVPEQRDMKPKDYWDARARGLGGQICSCGEENLLNLPGDRYHDENILIHEFAHTIHNYGLSKTDPTFDERLKETYERALEAGRWEKTYAATNREEYWAEAVQDYFDCNATNARTGVHNDVNTREELRAHDPELFALVDEVFRQNSWRYVRYDQRQREAAGKAAAVSESKP